MLDIKRSQFFSLIQSGKDELHYAVIILTSRPVDTQEKENAESLYQPLVR